MGPSLNLNTFGKSVAHDLLMFHVGMNLDLVDDRLDTSVCQQFVHMMRIEVAHPDGTDLPHIDILFHDSPSLLDLSGYRPMNQHQVNIRSPECFNSPVERLAYLSATYGIGRDFRNNEHFTPADTAFLDSVPHFGLVVVALRRIDQTVSQSDGVFHTLCGSLLESRRADPNCGISIPLFSTTRRMAGSVSAVRAVCPLLEVLPHNLSVWFLSGNTFVGHADQHPLVSVIDYDTVTPILHTHSQFSVYALYKGMGVTLLSGLVAWNSVG
uniref:Uncharacterized protein n=1 Tax=uncultured bacterium 33g20 TaxID=1701364 RepID=A0A0M3Q109_9BACT|nr:conserved hypothetical protein [uncultured bacterium 33g20]